MNDVYRKRIAREISEGIYLPLERGERGREIADRLRHTITLLRGYGCHRAGNRLARAHAILTAPERKYDETALDAVIDGLNAFTAPMYRN